MIWSQERYLEAVRFAAEAHREQTVPGTDGLPYLLHVVTVGMEVLASLHAEPSSRGDLAVACALLHDMIEDTDVGREEIAKRFGAEVAAGVAALTKDRSLVASQGKAAAMTDSLLRIREQPLEVWRVKLADRITNLQPPPAQWSQAKCLRYRDEAREILEALGEASPFLAARLTEKIGSYPIRGSA
jgi:(p)ppGpp synthase/HD superfamily hydrolase